MAESKPFTRIFRFSAGSKTYTLSSTSSSTVLKALLTNKYFEKTYNAKTKAGKDVIIQRGKSHRPAISVNFPCSLIEDNEQLHIRFIKHDRSSHGPNTGKCNLHSKNPDDLMVFLVSTTGGKYIQNAVMENNRLKRSKVNWVCVVAVKGETVKKALRRDGRFAKGIFKMDGALEDDECLITDIQNLVNELKDHKLYTIFRNSSEAVPDSLERQNLQDELNDQSQSNFKADPEVVPDSQEMPNFETDPADSSQHSKIPNAHSSGKASLVEMTTTTKSDRTKYENIPNTTEIFKILRTQFASLVEQLKARENVKTPAKVQQLLREEFSKETQCFSEIKTVKTLMDLSASVCQVRHNNQARGTGFLLFGTCILTNAHVVTDEGQLLDKLSVSFDFEDLSTASKQEFAIKKTPLAYEYKYTLQHSMDFAVLELDLSAEALELNLSAEASELDSSAEASELDSSAKTLPPPLLKHYRATPMGKGVCIIGHPAGGVKKMDMCLNLKPEAGDNKYMSQYIGEKYFETTLELDGNQIEYNTCFFHGSSGSPVFDESRNVIGMHSGGYAYKKGNEPFRREIQFAHSLLPILASICRKIKDNPSSVCKSLCAALEGRLADDKTIYPNDVDMV